MKIFNRKQKKKINDAGKIDYIPCVNHSPADAMVMKIYPQHFYIIIRLALQPRQFADSIETEVNNDANKRTDKK